MEIVYYSLKLKFLSNVQNGTVILFGGKARDALRSIRVQYVEGVYALAPPGANHKPAKPSWEKAIEIVKSKRK